MTVHGKSYTTQLTRRLQVANSRAKLKCRSMQHEESITNSHCYPFCFGLPESDCGLSAAAGLWPEAEPFRSKLLQSRKARAGNWQAETRSNAVLPRKESESR